MSKIRFKQLLLRLRACYHILTNPKNSWAFISLDSSNLLNLLEDRAIDTTLIRHKLQEYNFYCLVKKVADSKDEATMLLAKLQFENEASEYKNKDKK